MLRQAGLASWPVLIATRQSYNLDPEYTAMLFNHAIAAIWLKDRIVFLDPTAQTCSFGDLPQDDQDRQVLVLEKDNYRIETTPLYPASHNLLKQRIQLKINPDESVVAQKQVATFGVYDQAQRYWLLYTPPELIADALKEKIQEFSIGAKLDQYDIQNVKTLDLAVVLNYTFHGPEYFTDAGTLRIMPHLISLDTSLVAKDQRRYDIDLAILDTKEIFFEIEIPDNFRIRYIPANVEQGNPWLKFSAEYKYSAGKLTLRQRVEAKKTIISAQDYPAFKEELQKLAKDIKQRVVLERVK
jgi:hypothetical protein